MGIFDVLHERVYDFIMIFARLSAMLAFAPVFGANNIPGSIKAMFAFVLSVMFTTFLHPVGEAVAPNGVGLVIQLAGEATIGAAIGFVATLIFEIIIFAGYIIDYMIGFGFINIVDPQSGTSISIFAFFYSFLTLLLFLLVDAHHVLIEVMVRSYELIPVFGADITLFSINHLMRMVSAIFYVGFQIASPIFIIMFTIDFTLGLISKTMPQLQIIVIGFPIKISVGLIAMGIILKPTIIFIMSLLTEYRDNLLWMMKYFGGGGT